MAGESTGTLAMAAAVVLAVATAANAHAASLTTVPMQFHGTEPPVVMLRVQGKELPLQLDLGDSSSLVLHPEILAALDSKPTTESFKGFSQDGKIDTPIVRLDLVELGDLKLTGVAARLDVHDEAFRNYKKTEIGAVGFVGTGIFKTGQILVDYARAKLTISMPKASGVVRNICRGPSIPFIERSWGLMTPVSTDLGDLEFGLDTGAPTILLSRSTATAANLPPELDSTELRKFDIGGKSFGPQKIDIWDIPTPAGMAGLIGDPFFRAHVLCFDYRALKLHVQ